MAVSFQCMTKSTTNKKKKKERVKKRLKSYGRFENIKILLNQERIKWGSIDTKYMKVRNEGIFIYLFVLN